jgi:hypothetical protein
VRRSASQVKTAQGTNRDLRAPTHPSLTAHFAAAAPAAGAIVVGGDRPPVTAPPMHRASGPSSARRAFAASADAGRRQSGFARHRPQRQYHQAAQRLLGCRLRVKARAWGSSGSWACLHDYPCVTREIWAPYRFNPRRTARALPRPSRVQRIGGYPSIRRYRGIHRKGVRGLGDGSWAHSAG